MYLRTPATAVLLLSLLLSVPAAIPLTVTQAQSLFNETLDLIQPMFNETTASPQITLNGSSALAQSFRNENTTTATGHLNGSLAPSQNFIPYKVPRSPTTILFHGFGGVISIDELPQTLGGAISIAFGYITNLHGSRPITNGFFKYTQEFPTKDEVTFAVGDFREVGRPMTYYVLSDVIRGTWEFMTLPGQSFQDVRFEIELEDVGYVGSGYVERQAASPRPAFGDVP